MMSTATPAAAAAATAEKTFARQAIDPIGIVVNAFISSV